MTMNNEEKDYILLNKLFGACLDMVQGTGGNISVKEEHLFGSDLCYIKSSGVALSNTEYNKVIWRGERGG